MNSLKAKHKILYGLMTIIFLSVWYCRDIFTSTYVKLQDAYVAESGINVGNWKTIGYNMPGSNNFTYAQGEVTASTTALKGLKAKSGWTATNNAKLNDCAANSQWTITIAEADNADASKGSPITYNATTPAAGDNAGDCAALTPNFTKIGK